MLFLLAALLKDQEFDGARWGVESAALFRLPQQMYFISHLMITPCPCFAETNPCSGQGLIPPSTRAGEKEILGSEKRFSQQGRNPGLRFKNRVLHRHNLTR
jgi:hypothetical protein